MRFPFWFALVAIAVGALCAASAQAAIQLNDYTLAFSDAAGAIPSFGGTLPANLAEVDSWQFLATAVVGFQDNDTSGSITKGDTFTDFIWIRITGFTNDDADGITPAGYGGYNGTAGAHELTLIAVLNGTQLTNAVGGVGSFSVDAAPLFDYWFDAFDDSSGHAYTKSTNTNLASYTDGIKVETSTDMLITGSGSQDQQTLPDGAIDLLLGLEDLLVDPLEFEKDFIVDGVLTGLKVDASELVVGIADANNNSVVFSDTVRNQFSTVLTGAAGNLTYAGVVPGLLNSFTVGGTTYDFGFTTSSDGSFNKAAIPEPASVIVWGLIAMFAAGFAWLRRRSV